MEKLLVQTKKNKEVIDLTDRIEQLLKDKGWQEGICHLFTTHTTCCLTTGEIGEGTAEDFLEVLEKMIPKINFRHAHNPAHAPAHMASSLVGPCLTIPVENGQLVLGTWQRIMLVELDGPREREVVVSFITDIHPRVETPRNKILLGELKGSDLIPQQGRTLTKSSLLFSPRGCKLDSYSIRLDDFEPRF